MNEFEIYKARLRAKGQLALPGEEREILNVKEGDDLIFRANEEGQVIVERALVIPPEQAWFWSKRWQRIEREAQADIEAGRVSRYNNVDEAISSLKSLENANSRAG